jgi:tetratricopeptide (TPR) repeat protein
MINDPLDEVMALKQKAVVLRNRNKLELSLAVLDEAVSRLEVMRVEPGQAPHLQASILSELADTYGMKGGVNRRLGDLKTALAEYRAGLENEGPNTPSTYNLGNEIVLSITLGEARLDDPELRARMEEAVRRLKAQTAGPRSDEWWAWADLAQFSLLCGDVESARQAYQRGRATGPSASEIQRPLEVLSEIATALEEAKQPERAQQIRSFVSEMQTTV